MADTDDNDVIASAGTGDGVNLDVIALCVEGVIMFGVTQLDSLQTDDVIASLSVT
jgi:hypothetical protein